MRLKLLLFLVFFIASCGDIGEGYKWKGNTDPVFSRHYGTIGYDYGWNVAYSPFDEGIVIVGQKSRTIGSKSDLWAIKTNKRGVMEWQKDFGGQDNDVGYDVIASSDGGFLFVGFSWSYGKRQQVYAIKTDFYGNTEWEETYGGSMWDVGTAVIEINGGGYLVAGFSNSPTISSGNSDIFLIKVDVLGKLVWQKAYGNKAFPNHEWAYDLVETANGDFIIVGARDRYNKGSLNGLIIRVDKDGNLIWEKELLDENQISESIYSISKTVDGSYFLCSTINSIDSADKYQPRIIKIGGSGNIDWSRIFSSNGREYHQYRATSTISGDVVIVGSSWQKLATGFKENAFMTKVSNNGDLVWSHPYGTSDEDDWGWSAFETPNKNLVMVGSTKSFGASLFDIYLIGTNAEGLSK